MPAIAETFEIKAYNNDSTAVVFDMTDYLLSDQKLLSPFSLFNDGDDGERISIKISRKRKFLYPRIKGFEDNISVRSFADL